jgi:hypothetical protein
MESEDKIIDERKARHLAQIKAWKLKNKSKVNAYVRKYDQAHREQKAQYSREYYQKNKAIIEAYNSQQTENVKISMC